MAERAVATARASSQPSPSGEGNDQKARRVLVFAPITVEDAFDSLSIDTFYSETIAVNLASRRVLKKIGFRNNQTTFPNRFTPVLGAEFGDVV